MKRIAYWCAGLIFLASTAFECGNREECCELPPCSDIASLNGMWRLDYFQNTATGAIEKDPGEKDKSVVFNFLDDQKSGTISGHTFVNTISGAYTLGPDCTFRIVSFGGSKVGEPAWSGKAWLPSDSTGGKGTYHVTDKKLILRFDQNPEQMVFEKSR